MFILASTTTVVGFEQLKKTNCSTATAFGGLLCITLYSTVTLYLHHCIKDTVVTSYCSTEARFLPEVMLFCYIKLSYFMRVCDFLIYMLLFRNKQLLEIDKL